MAGEFGYGSDICRLLGIGVEREVLGHLPEENLPKCEYPEPVFVWQPHTLPSSDAEAITSSLKGFLLLLSRHVLYYTRTRQRVPVGIENGAGVAAEQGKDVGQLAALVDGDDNKGASTARLVVDREVLGVGLGKGVSGRRQEGARERRLRTLMMLLSQAFLDSLRLS